MGRDHGLYDLRELHGISIHSPRMGRDHDYECINGYTTISIHSPRMGRDLVTTHNLFEGFISIHSPRMGRDLTSTGYVRRDAISIHSPRMGRDKFSGAQSLTGEQFQSTLPAWGETGLWKLAERVQIISIHSPRMGRDVQFPLYELFLCHFNPLSPHGERRAARRWMCLHPEFQSTLPAWGETFANDPNYKPFTISIHSPRMGRDHAVTHTPH